MNALLKNKIQLAIYFTLTFLISCVENESKIIKETKDFCAKIHHKDSIHLSARLKNFEKQMTTQTGAYVLEDGGGSLVTRAWLCENAEKTIDIQYFIFSTDNVGLIACDYLVRAADRGVKIRIIVDDIMVEAGIQDILTIDSHENISIKIYNPGVNLGKNIFKKIAKFTTDFRDANQRMHNKILLVDSKIAITGGRNIADEYFDYDHEYNFRDRDILMLGKVSTDIKSSFETYWNHKLCVPVRNLVKEEDIDISDTLQFELLHQYACDSNNFWPQVRKQIENLPNTFDSLANSSSFIWSDSIYFVSDLPGKNTGNYGLSGGGITTSALLNLIGNAKSTIDIQSPYLITTEVGLNLFKAVIERGVKIRILTNSLASTDNLEAFGGYQKVRKDLLKAGVRIFEFKPDAAERVKIATGALQKELKYKPIFGLHAKSMVIDNNITVIGTFNLDPRSANLNTECFAEIHNKQLAEGVLKGMEIEFKPENSWETTLKFNPDDKVGKMKRFKTWTKKIIPKSIL